MAQQNSSHEKLLLSLHEVQLTRSAPGRSHKHTSSGGSTPTEFMLRACLMLRRHMADLQFTFGMAGSYYATASDHVKDRCLNKNKKTFVITTEVFSASYSTEDASAAVASSKSAEATAASKAAAEAAAAEIARTLMEWQRVAQILLDDWVVLLKAYRQSHPCVAPNEKLASFQHAIERVAECVKYCQVNNLNVQELQYVSHVLALGIILIVGGRVEDVEAHLSCHPASMNAFTLSICNVTGWIKSLWWFRWGEAAFCQVHTKDANLQRILLEQARMTIELELWEPTLPQSVAMHFQQMWKRLAIAQRELEWEQESRDEYTTFLQAGHEQFRSLVAKSEAACNKLNICIFEERVRMHELAVQHPRIHQEQELYQAHLKHFHQTF
jgi:hypothetical protein